MLPENRILYALVRNFERLRTGLYANAEDI